jgi:hypothetical protein
MPFDIKMPAPGVLQLTANARLSASEDFDALVEKARGLGVISVRARKTGYVAARNAERDEEIITQRDGMETRNVARPGDWIATNMDAGQNLLRDGTGQVNRYVIQAARFAELYEPTAARSEFGKVYRAKGVVDAVAFVGGFDILAPWGERQHAAAGYIVRNGKDVYGIEHRAFEATYEILKGCERIASRYPPQPV